MIERRELRGVVYRENLSARELSTFGVGAAVPRVYEVGSVEAAEALLGSPHLTGSGLKFLGAGSNVILPDAGLTTPVVRLTQGLKHFFFLSATLGGFSQLRKYSSESAPAAQVPGVGDGPIRLLVFGGCPLIGLSRKLCQQGFSGLEFAAGIPATLGGAVRMNAGAHGSQMQDVVRRVYFLLPDASPGDYQESQLSFGYRHTNIPDDALIVAAELELRRADPEMVQSKRQEALEYRRRTQPLQLRSAGSVFRNPDQDSAGSLLERAGMKGVSQGAVCYSKLHANWLVVDPELEAAGAEAKARDVKDLVRLGQESVREQWGIELKTEIIFW